MHSSQDRPTEELAALIADTFEKPVVAWKKPRTGLSVAQRFVVTFEDGARCFVKAAMDERTEEMLRVDHRVMSELDADFVPGVLAWLEPPGRRPVLVIEDLSEAHWPADHDPVLWKPGQFEVLFDTLERVAASEAPASLPSAVNPTSSRWRRIGEKAGAFSRLDLCSDRWFEQALPHLIAAEEEVVLEGEALTHGDVRSDNLCFLDGRMVLVDWSEARRGSPLQDLSYVLATLPLEGGPDPYTILPDGGAWAAYWGGAFAGRTMRDRQAPPWLRAVFKRLTIIALRWAEKSRGMPPWEGRDWREI